MLEDYEYLSWIEPSIFINPYKSRYDFSVSVLSLTLS